MNKIKLALFMLMLIFNNVFSQEINESMSSSMKKGFYVGFQTGYAYKISTENLANSFEMYNVSMENDDVHYESIYISHGQGFNIGGAAGYMFNKHIGAEIGISYLWGKTFEARNHSELTNEKYTLSSNMLRLLPSIVLQIGLEKFNPYAKFGVVFGIGNVSYTSEDYYVAQTTETKYYGGMAFGINAVIGTDFRLNDRFSLFGEINTMNMSYGPTKNEITEATENGQDILPNLRVYDKEVEYVDSYVKKPYNPNNPEPDYNQPRQEMKFKLPFGSIGLNIGLKINL